MRRLVGLLLLGLVLASCSEISPDEPRLVDEGDGLVLDEGLECQMNGEPCQTHFLVSVRESFEPEMVFQAWNGNPPEALNIIMTTAGQMSELDSPSALDGSPVVLTDIRAPEFRWPRASFQEHDYTVWDSMGQTISPRYDAETRTVTLSWDLELIESFPELTDRTRDERGYATAPVYVTCYTKSGPNSLDKDTAFKTEFCAPWKRFDYSQ